MNTDLQDTIETQVPIDEDERLDEAAQGTSETSDEAPDGSEIDAIGRAAGYVDRDGKPFRGIAEIDRRDDRRWELEADSAETDFATD